MLYIPNDYRASLKGHKITCYSLANEENILHSDSYTLASSVTTISILISIHKEQNWWTVD